jgi:SAM-dependent methyltransferase
MFAISTETNPDYDDVYYSSQAEFKAHQTRYKLEKSKNPNPWLNRVKNIDNYLGGKTHIRVLDVGCGFGSFLIEAKNYGWDVMGIDISDNLRKYLEQQGVPLFCGVLADAKLPDSSFDVVRASHLIEHLSDPYELVKEAWRILKPDGIMVLELPNSLGLIPKIKRFAFIKYHIGECGNLNPPIHLFDFNPKSLRTIMFRQGFQEINLRQTPRGHKVYFPFYNSHGIKKLITLSIMALESLTDMGDILVGYYRKPSIL